MAHAVSPSPSSATSAPANGAVDLTPALRQYLEGEFQKISSVQRQCLGEVQAIKSAMATSHPPLTNTFPAALITEYEDPLTIILRSVQEDGFLALRPSATALRFLPLSADLSSAVPEERREDRCKQLKGLLGKLFSTYKDDFPAPRDALSRQVVATLAFAVERRAFLVAAAVERSNRMRMVRYYDYVCGLLFLLHDACTDKAIGRKIVSAVVARQFPEKVVVLFAKVGLWSLQLTYA